MRTAANDPSPFLLFQMASCGIIKIMKTECNCTPASDVFSKKVGTHESYCGHARLPASGFHSPRHTHTWHPVPFPF